MATIGFNVDAQGGDLKGFVIDNERDSAVLQTRWDHMQGKLLCELHHFVRIGIRAEVDVLAGQIL
ncbi:hypothetical protein D3C86_1336780 [compost metagenome]